MYREYLGELVGEKVVLIAEVMNRQQYLPKIPAESEVSLIFDTTFPDIQPYLFRVSTIDLYIFFLHAVKLFAIMGGPRLQRHMRGNSSV